MLHCGSALAAATCWTYIVLSGQRAASVIASGATDGRTTLLKLLASEFERVVGSADKILQVRRMLYAQV